MGPVVLLLGNGAREHAIAEALSKSTHQPELHAFMTHNNPGIAPLCKTTKIGSVTDVASINAYAEEISPEFAIIGPEAPLAAGVVDALEEQGISCIGPTKDLARLETSKAFARQLLEQRGIPGNPKFKVFTAPAGIREWIDELQEYVVKADGLHGGKGVKVSGSHLATPEEGVAYAEECIATDGSVIIEEKLEGEEFSLMAFTDGNALVNMPCVQDHKRAYEGDEGPNTGGMGSYSDPDHSLPFLTEQDIEQAKHINEQVLSALAEHGTYKGIMYGGFMVTKNGVKLIEYNARFGDPEAMNVLPLLEADFVDLCKAISNGTLSECNVTFAQKATVCKYVVPEGYPDNPVRGVPLTVDSGDAFHYYAAVDQQNDKIVMTGSRALGVVGIAATPEEAERIAEKGVQGVQGEVFSRKDIGTNALRQQRIAHMQAIR